MRTILLLILPAICQAGENCPWMNEGTAGFVLGGPVTSTVLHAKQNADDDDATCKFVLKRAPSAYGMRIEVKTMSAPSTQFSSFIAKCGSNPTPLKAIGNEAIACSENGKHGQRIEQVIGRVRDRSFIVRVTMLDQTVDRALLRERVRNAAEQVAGILF